MDGTTVTAAVKRYWILLLALLVVFFGLDSSFLSSSSSASTTIRTASATNPSYAKEKAAATSDIDTMASTAKSFLIYGGSGGLGRHLVSKFKSLAYVVSIDLVKNDEANANILLNGEDSWKTQSTKILKEVGEVLGDKKLDAIFCVAGGWGGGNAASENLIDVAELMWKQSVHSSVIAGQVAVKYLKEGGLVTLTGSYPCLNGTSGMIGYGIAKAAVHQLTKSFAAEGSGLPKSSKVVAVLPVTLDTPANRQFNPGADTSSWTSLDDIAEQFLKWEDGSQEVQNGSLIAVITKDGKTEFSTA